MNQEEFWQARPILGHVRDFARSRRVSPLALLGSLVLRANASLDPNVVLPPTIGGVASLNLFVAFVGPSGHGKGATEAAARDATNLPHIEELPIGSGEGLARTFAANGEGKQEIRSAMFTASEVDGLAALGGRQGSTLTSVMRQLYSGEAIGSANAQKHTRVIVAAHTYRAVMSVGVQPERAAPLLNDTAGTAQRFLWLPVGDPEAPEVRPLEPERWTVGRALVPAGRLTILDLPAETVAAMEDHHLRKLRGDPDVNPLDGHALLTRAKVAAALMVLDGRMHRVSLEDWELSGVLMRVSDRTRARIGEQSKNAARKANRARAIEAAERDEFQSERKLQRAKDGVLRWLAKFDQLPANQLRSKLKADVREHLGTALAELAETGAIVATEVDRGNVYRLAPEVQGVPPVHPPNMQVKDGVPEVQGVPPAMPSGMNTEHPDHAETSTCKVCRRPCKPSIRAHVECITGERNTA